MSASDGKLHTDGQLDSNQSTIFGSGHRPSNKYQAIAPTDTATGAKPQIYTGDADAVRVSVIAADASNTVRLNAVVTRDMTTAIGKTPVGADIAAAKVVYITTDVPEVLEVERVTSNGAPVEVIVDVMRSRNQR